MTSLISRRGAVAATLALPAAFAPVAEAVAQSATPAAAEAASAAAVVRRWLADAVAGHDLALERDAHPDIVVELHGAGGLGDGRPRLIEGLPAVRSWINRVRSAHATPPQMRLDQMVEQGETVVTRTENIWTLHVAEAGTEPPRRVQAVAAFYTVRDGRIARIIRFTDRVGRAEG